MIGNVILNAMNEVNADFSCHSERNERSEWSEESRALRHNL